MCVSISNRFRDICIQILSAHGRTDGRKKASQYISPVHSVHLADIIKITLPQLSLTSKQADDTNWNQLVWGTAKENLYILDVR